MTKTMTAYFLVFFTVGPILLTDARTVPLVPNEEEFQPLCSRKCQQTQDHELKGGDVFPRYQCSCSQSCVVYGDCCYDSPFKNTTSWPQFDFVCLSVVGRGRYRAVSSCPASKRSDFCRDALGHLPPVTSATTNVTYGNVFCASCHGDAENLVIWNVELRCFVENENETQDDARGDATRVIYNLDEFWRLNEVDKSKRLCKYHVHFEDFKHLDDLELRTCAVTKRISRCSASWSDLTIMEKCRSYEDPVYFHNTGFQNSHCAQCNYLDTKFSDCISFGVRNMLEMKLVDQSVTDFCVRRGSESCVNQLLNTSKGRPFSISKTLNIEEKECVPPEGKRCCDGKRYDFRTKMCRSVVRKG